MTDNDTSSNAERDQMGEQMSSRLASRFDSGDQSEEDLDSDPSQTDMPSQTDKSSKTAQASVKDRPSVLMYLPEELHTELDIRFDELNARYKREHGEALEKNRDYYPAIVKAGLEGTDIEDILDL